MKFFIDSADLNEIREATAWGLLDGATTNPTLVAKTGVKDFKEHYKKICSIVKGPVSLEAVSLKAEDMVKEAFELSKIAENAVIKIPMTPEGLKAVKKLSAENVKTNATLIFSVSQALLAAKAGASYTSIFVGRLDDAGHDGMQVVKDAVNAFREYGFKTQVIAASIRHPLHVAQCAQVNAPIATIPFPVLKKLFQHPLTEDGLNAFLEDWKKVAQTK